VGVIKPSYRLDSNDAQLARRVTLDAHQENVSYTETYPIDCTSFDSHQHLNSMLNENENSVIFDYGYNNFSSSSRATAECDMDELVESPPKDTVRSLPTAVQGLHGLKTLGPAKTLRFRFSRTASSPSDSFEVKDGIPRRRVVKSNNGVSPKRQSTLLDFLTRRKKPRTNDDMNHGDAMFYS
jgi:hypothetical protein